MPWWREAVIYQIYPRSFADASGDGVGDLEGIRQRLDYLAWLGVDAIWLSPIFRSPMADFGYDISDHTDIDPVFGDLSDFDRLVKEAHDRKIRVLIDWVPNHTSDQHPWFVESRSSRESPKRDWYIWRDGKGDSPPNNWRATFSDDPSWTYDHDSGQWYLHIFLPDQPDLNWANPDVESAMHDVLRFWLDRGVDGFRADAVHCIGKDPSLADLEPPLAGLPYVDAALAAKPHPGVYEHPLTVELLRRIRHVLNEYDGERMMVGETTVPSIEALGRYYGSGDGLHLAFNMFASWRTGWNAELWRDEVETVYSTLRPVGAWPSWFLSNHDGARLRTRLGGSADRACAAAVLLLTLPGTPFLYAGGELGLEDAVVPPEQQVDPGGRDGCRAPIPWKRESQHGWGAQPWLPWPPEAAERSAEAQEGDPMSVLWLYRDLLMVRRHSPALRVGEWELVPAADDVLAYQRHHQPDRRLVLVNFSDEIRTVETGRGLLVEIASRRELDGRSFDGRLDPNTAVVLR